jgi:hypothetical protein
MNSFIICQIEITPPPIVIFDWGRLGGGQTEMHKRTTPKIFARAKQLHRWIPLQE